MTQIFMYVYIEPYHTCLIQWDWKTYQIEYSITEIIKNKKIKKEFIHWLSAAFEDR